MILKLSILLLFCTSNGPGEQANGKLVTQMSESTLETGCYYIIDENGIQKTLINSTETYILDPNPILTTKHFKNIGVSEYDVWGMSGVELFIELTEKGAKRWENATEMWIGKKMAFVIDDQLIYAPDVLSKISNGMTGIGGESFTKETLESFKKNILKTSPNTK